MHEIIKTEEKSVTSSFTSEQLDLIKNQVARGADDNELKMFLYQAAKMGLDPLAKQIYFQKRSNKKTNKSDVVFITSIDGYRLIAARTEKHAGTDDAIFELDEKGYIIRATVSVYKIVSGHVSKFSASASWEEYCPQAPMDFMWTKMPRTMLGKCAESLALRKAFPAELSGAYTKEEMDQSVVEDNKKTVNQSVADISQNTVDTHDFSEIERINVIFVPGQPRKAFSSATIDELCDYEKKLLDFCKGKNEDQLIESVKFLKNNLPNYIKHRKENQNAIS